MPNIWEGRFKLQGHCLLIMAFTYGMCVQPNVFHSILVFVPNIGGRQMCTAGCPEVVRASTAAQANVSQEHSKGMEVAGPGESVWAKRTPPPTAS